MRTCIALLLLAFPVQAQGIDDWLSSRTNQSGVACCRLETPQWDCEEIPYMDAQRLRLGSLMHLPKNERTVPVNTIHPSPPMVGNKAYGCVPGCLFRPPMY